MPAPAAAVPGTAGRATTAALISGKAALGLLGVTGFRLPLEPLVLVAQGRRVRLDGAPFRLRHVELSRIAWERHDGVATADLALAIADAALDAELPLRTLRVAVDDVRWRFRIPITDLSARWRGLRCHPGGRRLLDELPELERESEGERDAFTRLFRAFPPEPDCRWSWWSSSVSTSSSCPPP